MTNDETTNDLSHEITELIGVYNADSGLAGEAAYLFGKFLGKRHCALCDITHSPVRRKPEWDRMAAELLVPFSLDHLNDTPQDVNRLVQQHGAPLVVGRLFSGALIVLLTAEQLELSGSVSAFHAALTDALATRGFHLAHPYRTPVAEQTDNGEG
jgi:hypothetical protein